MPARRFSTRTPSHMFSMTVFVQGIPLLLQAAVATVGISLAGLVIGFFVAIGVCSARLSPQRCLRRARAAHMCSSFAACRCSCSFCSCITCCRSRVSTCRRSSRRSAPCRCVRQSYIAEILRGGFLDHPAGQIEAARMLGLAPFDMLRRILVPQAFKLTLPSLVNEMVLLDQGVVADLGGRRRRDHAHRAEHRREHLSAAGSLCRGRPDLLRDQRRALARSRMRAERRLQHA